MGDRTRTTVIAVVTSVWAANFAAGLFPPLGYEPDQAINGIFMTIVGGLFAVGARAKAQVPPAGPGGAHLPPKEPAGDTKELAAGPTPEKAPEKAPPPESPSKE